MLVSLAELARLSARAGSHESGEGAGELPTSRDVSSLVALKGSHASRDQEAWYKATKRPLTLSCSFLLKFLHPPLNTTQTLLHHNTGAMSAIVEEPEGYIEPLKVLITLHDKMDTMDASGPLEVFGQAQHDPKNPGKASHERISSYEHTDSPQSRRLSAPSLRALRSTSSPAKELASALTSTTPRP